MKKVKKKLWGFSSKCLTFILALLMMISSLPLTAFASDTDAHSHDDVSAEIHSEEEKSAIDAEFSDGVFTITVDADEIYELIDSGSISREALLDLLPNEFNEALEADGGAADKAEALIRSYLTLMIEDDPERLYESFPLEMTLEYLTEEPDPLLWRIISKEKLFSSIDLVEVFIELEKSGKLDDVIDVNGAADVAIQSGMLNYETMSKMVDDIEKNDDAAYDKLVDEVVRIIVSDSDFKYISDKVVRDIPENERAMREFKAFVGEAAVDGLTVNGKIDKDLLVAYVDSIGGASVLLENGVLNNEMFEPHTDSKTIREIALEMDANAVIKIFGFTDLIDAIGTDKLASNEDILELIDYVALLKALLESGYFATIAKQIIASVDKNALLEIIPGYITNFSQSVSINGKKIYTASEAKLDVDLFTQVMAESIPTFDKLASDPTNAFSFVIDWELIENNINTDTTKTNYTFGIEVKIEGDTDRLAKLCEKIASYISIDNNGDTTTVVINVPAKVASLYLRAVNTDKLPEGLKNKVLHYLSMEITEDNVHAVVNDFTLEEIISIIENVDFTRVADKLENFFDLYSDKYTAALSMAKRAVNAMTYEKLLGVAERIGVDRIEDGIENNEQKIVTLRQEILDKLDEMEPDTLLEALRGDAFGDYNTVLADELRANANVYNLITSYLHKAIDKAFVYAPDSIVGAKLSDYYGGEGQFGPFEASFSYDVAPKLEQLLGSAFSEGSLEYAINFLKNTEIVRNVSLTVTFADIYEAKFVNTDGEVIFITYLPVGADLSVIYALPELESYDNEWTYDGENAALVMPRKDVRLTVLDPEHEHDMVYIKTVAPTCTEEGYDLYRCECNYEEYRNKLDALGHQSPDKWSITYPTKQSAGTAVKKCTRCSEIIDERVLPELPDQSDSFYTVTENFDKYCDEWTLTYSFKLDGEEFSHTISAGANHVWSDWTTVDPATIHKPGSEKKICGVCQKEETRVVDQLKPVYMTIPDEATGVTVSGYFAPVKEGEEGYTVAVDPNVQYIESAWKDADGIEKVDIFDLFDISIPGLTPDQYKYQTGLLVTIPIPAEYTDRDFVVYHKHDDGTIEKFASNDESLDEKHMIYVDRTRGEIRFTVESFSEFLVSIVHVHKYGSWQTDVDPTLERGGTLKKVCEDPEHVLIYELPKLSEVDYEKNSLAPTCLSGGYDKYTITVDGQTFTFVGKTYDALGHDYNVKWGLVKEPTFTSKGRIVKVCGRDNCTETISIKDLPALNETDYRLVVVTPPDCYTGGEYKYIYDIDGQSFAFEVTSDKLGHLGEWTVTPPTDTDRGCITRECERCGKLEIIELPSLSEPNSYVLVESKAPTCDTKGRYKYNYTAYDGQTVSFVIETDALGHQYYNWEIVGTAKKGQTVKLILKCSNDSTHRRELTLPELTDQNYNVEYRSPTCTEDGYEYYSCDYKEVTEAYVIDITFGVYFFSYQYGHDYTWEVTLAPTMNDSGLLKGTCANDHTHEDAHVIPALKYTQYFDRVVVVKPTCETTGTANYRYTYDGQTFEFNNVTLDAIGHSWGDWSVSVIPTDDTAGVIVRTCTNDATHKQTDTIPSLTDGGSKYTSEVIKTPTTTTPGIREYTYTDPQKGITVKFTVEIPAGHNYGPWVLVEEPGAYKTGKLMKVCADDPTHTLYYTLPALVGSSSYTHTVITAATCERSGLDEYKITVDGQTFTFELVTDARGHKYGVWTITLDPTKTTTGTLTKVCANDAQHKLTHTLPVLSDPAYTYKVLTEPTATEPGKIEYSYSYDGNIFRIYVEFPIDGHDYGEWVITKNPTSYVTGTAIKVCKNDPAHVLTRTLPKLNTTDYAYVDTVSPTCTEKGVREYTYYLDGQPFKFYGEISQLQHFYGDWEVTKPTHAAEGIAIKTCTREGCGHQKTVILPVLSDSIYIHTVEKEPTATEPGEITYKYPTNDGNDIRFTVEFPIDGHDYGDWEITKYPTKDETGIAVKVCKNDPAHMLTRTLPKLTDSSYTYTDTNPTCTEKGIREYTVYVNGDKIVFTVDIPALGHSYGNWEITVDPTVSTTGTVKGTCAHDPSHTVTYTLPVLNNRNYRYSYRTATCTVDGYDKYIYSSTQGSDQIYVEYVITREATGHDYGEWIVLKAPTKTADGTLARVCNNDSSHQITQTIPRLNSNDYGYSGQAATCTADGYEKYTYTYMGKTFEFTVTLPATNHSWSAWTVTSEPSVNGGGMLTRVCSNDPTHVQTHTLPKLDSNSYGHSHKDPTCAVNGYDKYTYSYGGKTFTFTLDIPAISHNYGAWTLTKEPTKNDTGTLKRVCSNDASHVQTHTLPRLNVYDYSFSYQAPTCAVDGYERYVYTYDGKSYEFIFGLAAHGHSYGDWTVTTYPTKNTSGILTKVCANDPSHTLTHTLPALNNLLYTYTLVKAPTCTQEGSEIYVYTHEGQSFTVPVTLGALQHAYGEWQLITSPTATTTGLISRTCKNDPAHKDTYALPVLNVRDYEYIVVTAPLCDTPGTAQYRYVKDESVFNFSMVVNPLGHNYSKWIVSVAPTETTSGVLVRTCSNDASHKERVEIPSFREGGSRYTSRVIKEPTETENGVMLYTYSYDGREFEFTMDIPATGTEAGGGLSLRWQILFIILLVCLIISVILNVVLATIILSQYIRIKALKAAAAAAAAAGAAGAGAAAAAGAGAAAVAVGEAIADESAVVAEAYSDAVFEADTDTEVAEPIGEKRTGKKAYVNIGILDLAFSDGETVTLEALKAKGLVGKSVKRYKVLADGILNKALIIEADEFSKAAINKISAVGGSIVKVRI